MVHVEPLKKKNKYKEVNVRVVTCKGENMGDDLEHGEISGQKIDEKIRKASHSSSKV
jgi:hypothetical protein